MRPIEIEENQEQAIQMSSQTANDNPEPYAEVYSPQEARAIISKEARKALSTYRKLLFAFSFFIALLLIAIVGISIKLADDVEDCITFTNQEKQALLDKLTLANRANTWQEIHPVGSIPPPRLAHAACSAGGKMYIHGGMYGSYNVSYGDLWVYTELTDSWEELHTTGDIPPNRLHHSLVDIDDNTLLLFGGFNYFMSVPTHASFGDLYRLDIPSKIWTRLDTSISGPAPSARGSHDAIYASGAMYVFGGFPTIGATGHHAELWKYTLSTNKWEDITAVNGPAGRIGFSWTIVDNVALLFGGGCATGTTTHEEYGQCNDTWSYDWNADSWTKLNPPSSPMHRRATHGDAAVNGIIYLFGGVHIAPGPTVTMLDDLYAFDVKNTRWIELVPNFGRGSMPPVTFGHSVVRINDRVIIYGGRAGAPSSPGTSQLWEYHTITPL